MAVNSFNAQNPPVTTKGDVFTFSTIPTRLGVGANNTVLTADSTAATGLKWAAVSTAQNYTLLNTGGTAMTGASKISVTGISGKDSLFVHIAGASSTSASVFMYLYINDDGTAKYGGAGLRMTTTGDISQEGGGLNAFSSAIVARQGNAATDTVFASAIINGCNSSGVKIIDVLGFGAGTDSRAQILQYIYTGTSTVSSIDITCQSGTFDAGTLYVYGA